MHEVLMAAAKSMPMDIVLKKLDEALKTLRADQENKPKKDQLEICCMMYCFKVGTEGMDMVDSIKVVVNSRKAADFFNPKPN